MKKSTLNFRVGGPLLRLLEIYGRFPVDHVFSRQSGTPPLTSFSGRGFFSTLLET